MSVLAVAGTCSSALADGKSLAQPAVQSISVEDGVANGGTAVRANSLRGPGNSCGLSASNCQERANLAIADPRASNNSFSGGFAVADNFQPSAATNLTSICWWGYYGPNDGVNTKPVAGNEGFKVRIWSNSQGVPQTLVAEFNVGTNFLNGDVQTAGTTLTRSASIGQPTGAAVPACNATTGDCVSLHSWTATIPPLALSANTCYWLEVTASSVANVNQRFRWVDATSTTPNDGVTLQVAFGAPPVYTFNSIVNSFDRAFCLGFDNAATIVSPSCGVPPPAPNNSCANATNVTTLPFNVTGATYRSAFSAVPFCGGNPVNAPVVFYRVVGNGTTFTASTCGANTDFDTVVNVYCSTVTSGTGATICGTGNANLRCVANNDTGPATCTGGTGADPSQVSWPTVNGNVYIVAVYGFEITLGGFDFSITSDGVQAGVTGTCVSDRCPLDNSAITLAEVDACSNATSTNSDCAGAGVGRFTLGQQFKGTAANAPVGPGSGTTRDFDFWEYDVVNGGALPDNSGGSGISWLRVSYQTEFPGVFNFFSGACNAPTNNGTFLGGAFTFYQAFGTPAACQERNIIVDTAANDLFRLNLLPVDFGGIPCSGGEADYRIRVTLEPTGACCIPATACFVTAEIDCTGQSGTFSGANTTCSPVDPCNAPTTIACCRGSTCSVLAAAACTDPAGLAGAFASTAAACNSGSATTPCCYGDYNKANGIEINDIFDFLNDWFAGSNFADTGGDGSTAPDINSIFDFLNAWFAGGC